MLDYQILKQNSTTAISEMVIRNNNGNKSVSWRLSTGDNVSGSTITSSIPFSLNESKTLMVIIQNNYISENVYPTNVSINSTSNQDSEQGVAITG